MTHGVGVVDSKGRRGLGKLFSPRTFIFTLSNECLFGEGRQKEKGAGDRCGSGGRGLLGRRVKGGLGFLRA